MDEREFTERTRRRLRGPNADKAAAAITADAREWVAATVEQVCHPDYPPRLAKALRPRTPSWMAEPDAEATEMPGGEA